MEEDSCRICLNFADGSIALSITFFHTTIWGCITELASIPIENDKNLPQVICKKCFGNLGSAIQLRNRIIDSQTKLQSLATQ